MRGSDASVWSDSSLSATQQTQILSRAFGGARSGAAILALVSNVGELKGIYDKTGAAAKQWGADVAAQAETPAHKFHAALNLINVELVKLGAIITPVVANVVDAFTRGTGAAGTFERTVAGAFKDVSGVLGANQAAALKSLAVGIGAATTAWVAYRTAAALAAIATTVATGGLSLVIPAIAALAAGVFYASQRSSGFRNVLQSIGQAVGPPLVALSGRWRQRPSGSAPRSAT